MLATHLDKDMRPVSGRWDFFCPACDVRLLCREQGYKAVRAGVRLDPAFLDGLRERNKRGDIPFIEELL